MKENWNIWMTDKEYQLVTERTPIPTVDLVILRERGPEKDILLLVRKTGYEAGNWCLIGGRQWLGETAKETIKRQAADLDVEVEIIPPFAPNFPAWVHDDPTQDKTKHAITNVYPARIISGTVRQEGEEYKGFRWFRVGQLPSNIAYHHRQEIQKALEQLNKYG